jgi:heat shock protein HspQ
LHSGNTSYILCMGSDCMTDDAKTPTNGQQQPGAATGGPAAREPRIAEARFGIGDIVRHRVFPFRGVIFDVDPEFANTEEWWEAIPEEIRPSKDQPFYHLLAENDDSSYVAYVSQQNLLPDEDAEPVRHPAVTQIFESYLNGKYILRPISRN